ncbi:hypothetical protein HY496_01385 [Candidatus Woesearchaeota archaeon]|nr:hypothetical protein [Candidatus Woesearchaeota archaeon]
MNTKAASIILMLYEIVVVIVVVGIALTVASRLGDPETILKTTAAEDIAMMTNVLLAMSGDSVVEYPQDMSVYSVALSSEGVTVYKGDRSKDRDPTIRSFILPDGYLATGFTKQQARVCLRKDGKTMVLGECPAR